MVMSILRSGQGKDLSVLGRDRGVAGTDLLVAGYHYVTSREQGVANHHRSTLSLHHV